MITRHHTAPDNMDSIERLIQLLEVGDGQQPDVTAINDLCKNKLTQKTCTQLF
eukprot:gene3751-14299_t